MFQILLHLKFNPKFHLVTNLKGTKFVCIIIRLLKSTNISKTKELQGRGGTWISEICLLVIATFEVGILGSSVSKESACNSGDLGLIPRLKRSPGERNGNQPQYSCLGNSMDTSFEVDASAIKA